MDFYRVFPWDGISKGAKLAAAIFPSQRRQGAGRHDVPERDGIIYCSRSPVSAIAEILQGFRGVPINEKIFSRPDGKTGALVCLTLDESAVMIDLDDPLNLLSRKLRPSRVATRDRIITQNIARMLYDEEKVAGFIWWSTLEASWINATLFQKRVKDCISINGEIKTLHTKMPEVIEAVAFLNIEISDREKKRK